MTDKLLIDSNNFEALAFGIFESAVSTDSGRAALLDAYNSYNWNDEEKAKETLEYYGQALKFKHKDQTSFGSALEQIAPVKITDIPITKGMTDVDLYNSWEKANQEYLKTATEPQYIVARKQFQNDIKDYASQQRRLANSRTMEGAFGKTFSSIADLNYRFVRGVASGVEPLINSVVNIFTDGYELNSAITELTDPQKDDKFLSALAEGAGSVGGLLTSGAVAGPAGFATYVGTQAIDPVGTRYQETKSRTGDTSEALKAAGVEAVSQGLQVAGEATVFGKFTKGIFGRETGSVVKEIGRVATIEALAEGEGQAISNVAENIERQQPLLKDVGRGVATSAAVGGILAGGTTAGTKVFPSRQNTTARTDEIKEHGAPITPVTKQVVGPIEVSNVDTIPAESEFINSDTGEVITPSEGTDNEFVIDPQAIDTIPAPTEQAYITEDGQSHFQTAPNQYVQSGELPHDSTFFVSDTVAKKVAEAIYAGEHIVPDQDGKPAIEHIDDEGNKSYESLEVSTDPGVGYYPLSISAERNPSSQEKVRPIKLGQRIKEVNVNRSLGAAGNVTVTQRESTYSQRLRETSELPSQMKKVGEEGIFYTPYSDPEASADVNKFVQDAGIEGTIEAIKDPTLDLRLKNGLETYLHNYYNRRILEATAQGDTVALEKLGKDFAEVAPIIAQSGSGQGQAFRLRQGKIGIDGVSIVNSYKEAYEQALIDEGTAEGIDPLEIGEAPAKVEETTKQIQIAEQDLTRQQAIDAEFVSPEIQAITEVVTDLESTAQEKLDEDLTTIAEEAQYHQEVIQTTTKQAERTKRKDIQVIEKAVAEDSKELANALSDALDIKNITAEESQRLEQSITDSIAAAEKKATAEVTKAVKEERAARETEQKTRLERAEERISKAEEALNRRRTTAAEQLKKATLRKRGLESAGEDTSAIDARIKQIEESVTKAAQRVADAREAYRVLNDELNERTEAAQEAEELLNELESGIEIRVTPVGKKRAISVRTKRSGMDITNLFNKKSEAYGPLSALSRGVNELASTISQSIGAKTTNNARISELQRRINENKKALDKARTRETLSPSDKKKVEAAKKRLAELDRAKTEATLESRIPKKDREKYKKFKEAQRTAPKGKKEDSSAVKAAKDTLKKLNAERAKAERLVKRQEAAKQKALEAARQQTENQRRIGELETLLEDETLSDLNKKKIQAEIATRKASDEKNPVRRDRLYRLLIASAIGGIYGPAIGFISSTVYGPFVKSGFGLSIPTVHAFLKNIFTRPEHKYKYPFSAYWAGFTSPEAWSRGAKTAWIALTTGKRLDNIIPREELVALNDVKFKGIRYQDVIKDYLNFTRNLEFKSMTPLGVVQNIGILAEKVAGYSSGLFLRTFAAVEALTVAAHDSGFDRAAAAILYNKENAAGVTNAELQRYKYEPRENWKKAQAEARAEAETLNRSGIEVDPADEFLSAVERFQTMRPREIQISAFKLANQLVLNAPAAGYTGLAADHLQKFIQAWEGTRFSGIKYFIPFVNSLANQIGLAVELTPFGLLGLTGKKANRTSVERTMMISSAITGTATMAGLTLMALKNLELPEEERWFDIIGNYSSNKAKQDAFVQSGGILYSLKFGNTYIPFFETPLVLVLAGVASAVDRVRDGKDPAPENALSFVHAGFTMAASVLGGIGSISMLRGISDLADGIKDFGQGEEGADVKVVRSLANTVKQFVPPASILRMIARYTDNPVDAKKDIVSALVEGFPGLQSAYGRPALNIFGEPIPAGGDVDTINMHRIFSTKASDLDIRWLTENGYTVPQISNRPFSKKLQKYVEQSEEIGDAEKINYDLRYEAYRRAAPELRNLVSRYRSRFGYSAHNPQVQKAINKDFNRILARHTVAVLKR